MNNNYIKIWNIIDNEKDVACATLTEQEADEIIENSKEDGGDYHKEETYLYSDENFEEGFLYLELNSMLSSARIRGVSVNIIYSHLVSFEKYLKENLAHD